MKRITAFCCVLALLFCGCAQQKEKTPVPNTETEFEAVYETGDFRFHCTVKWARGTAFVTVHDTNAKGLTLSCDGRQVTFSKGAMLKSEDKKNIDPSNPALLLWEIFTALESGGNQCSLGTFTVDRTDGEIQRISVSDITITHYEGE